MTCAQLYWFFCDMVNQEDVSTLKTFDGPAGEKVQMVEAEARLYGYKETNHHIQLAFVGENVAGFLIYGVVFERIITVRCLYAEPWTLGLKLGKGLVNSLQPTPHTLIFQSRKSVPPSRMLGITEGSRKVIAEDEHFFTYAMEWINGRI